MKKIVLLLISALLLTASCKNVSEINVDPKAAKQVEPEMTFTSAQIKLARQMASPNYNNNVAPLWANYWTETTYISESNYNSTNRDVGGNIYFIIYTTVLEELKSTKENLEALNTVLPTQEIIKKNKIAAVDILTAYSFQYLVDNFGYVPYTEALDFNNTTPKYDSDAGIYDDLIIKLKNAIDNIDVTMDGFGSADLIYGNDMSKWKKFAASILLDMGLKKQDANLVNYAVNTGVFTDNADSAVFQFLKEPPYTNPTHDFWILQSRDGDFVVTQNFIDLMSSFNDTGRMAKYFDNNVTPYQGGIVGATNTYNNLTHPNPSLAEPDRPGTLLDYINVEFELAEAVERNYISGNAEDHYNAGITASFTKWGLTVADANAYLAQANVAYSTASGTFEEKIGIQKYIALYPEGHVAWTEARRLDFPQLAVAAQTGKPNPKRMVYPVSEPSVNGVHYQEAAAAMGGDDTTRPIFWDN